MKKRPLIPAEGVSNIELFYDLIFVYCISVTTSLCHHVEDGFLDLGTWLVFAFSFLVVLQIWLYTTFLINRYGDRSAPDNICLFVNMFLLYFLASGIRADWETSILTFNIAWALILANLIIHWLIKLARYDNLDADDRRIILCNVIVLGIQMAMVLTAAFLPAGTSAVLSWVALGFGTTVLAQSRVYRRKPSRFAHLSERCSLLVIVAFGETIVAVSIYMSSGVPIEYPILVFALVVGLFLIYMYEHDNMVDHDSKTDGMAYMTATAWIILVIGNLTVGLEYMPNPEVAFLPKSIFLTACLVLYLLTSFVLGRYNRPEFHYSTPYVVGRLGICAAIIVIAVFTNFDPRINLVCDTAAVYIALWHEWLLYHGRCRLVAFGHSLGYTVDDAAEAGMDFTTVRGRREIVRVLYRLRRERGRIGEAEGADEDDADRNVEYHAAMLAARQVYEERRYGKAAASTGRMSCNPPASDGGADVAAPDVPAEDAPGARGDGDGR